MRRAAIIVLDSAGCGNAPDAAGFGDHGADTLGHIARACSLGKADRAGLRSGPLRMPNLTPLGLGRACAAATGTVPPGLECEAPQGIFGSGIEVSQGKDTPSGHWEIAGAPFPGAWGYFPHTAPAFPPALIARLISEAGIPGILGGTHASGTEIINTFGAEHLRTGKPILYTSVDSVLQIAAHEQSFGLERLYAVCQTARRLVNDLTIGRVIARPFLGDAEAGFQRTPNRKDFAIPPPPGNIFDRADAAARTIVSVGKIGDIFAHRGTGREVKAAGNMALFDAMLEAWKPLPGGGFLFANFVDFDSEFGHRRDVPGYAAALEAFDARVPELMNALRPGDLVIFTADHGNDPTWRGTDHTREQIPIVCAGPGVTPRNIGQRRTFADIGQSAAAHLGLPPVASGVSFL